MSFKAMGPQGLVQTMTATLHKSLRARISSGGYQDTSGIIIRWRIEQGQKIFKENKRGLHLKLSCRVTAQRTEGQRWPRANEIQGKKREIKPPQG